MESAKKKEILNSYLEASKEWRYWKDETERLMVAATRAFPFLFGYAARRRYRHKQG